MLIPTRHDGQSLANTENKLAGTINFVLAYMNLIEAAEKYDANENPLNGEDLLNAYQDVLTANYALAHTPYSTDADSDFQLLLNSRHLRYNAGVALNTAKEYDNNKAGVRTSKGTEVFTAEEFKEYMKAMLTPKTILESMRDKINGGFRDALTNDAVRSALSANDLKRADGIVDRYRDFDNSLDVPAGKQAPIMREAFQSAAGQGVKAAQVIWLLDMVSFGLLSRYVIRKSIENSNKLIDERLVAARREAQASVPLASEIKGGRALTQDGPN